MATSYPYGFDVVLPTGIIKQPRTNLSEFVSLNIDFIARSSPKTNENLNGTELALSFALIASRGVVSLPSDNVEASVVVDEPDWSRIFEERFKMQISNSRREKTYTMYSNENEHVGEQLLEDQRKRTRDEPIISDTKKASIAKPFNVSFDEYVDSYENDRIEIFDYPEILDVEPLSGWEFDTPMPSWLKKAMDRHKTLITTIGDRTVLEPVAERCLQSLAKLNNEQIRMIGEMVKYEGIHGAVCKLRKIIQNIEELNLENDYLDKEVGYILELVRYTCEMLGKGIPQRKNSENDIDMFIKRHIFACFDDILDTHLYVLLYPQRPDLGKDISYGRFSLCERAGSKVNNDTKNFSVILKVLKTLRDMHRSLVKAIAIESGGALSKQVLNACINYAWFRIIVVLPSCCPYTVYM
ncbi:hypothetical protein RhiirA1_454370 [Rhizophagus irregularis]|uniref:Uncharacterized protein n=1 Tax=Rhizophagus irregularis TaxID=588596 RepID=A0A2N0S599_9GLOM|nr:hypothetical protein RhiirA1_454370 [Rhizophagus irregularis]